ncbi:hypothetical protein LAUMK42_05364 [Mycobacterium persicum]|uniref:Uncharacterized protein n=1 Tax=Mycobacterium persicum TaxID=1487726 RepID=A0AB38V1N8_9MYCO|nr:hypothetical protein LAUMK42_05364 [Mycobacterium persicum]
MRNFGLRTGLATARAGGPSRPHPIPKEFVALVHKLLSRVGPPTPDTDQYPSQYRAPAGLPHLVDRACGRPACHKRF